MMEARQHQQSKMGNPETAQLLLIVSDGRGLFMEGMVTVKTAVRQAREAKVFIVFVIIDSPNNKVFKVCDLMLFELVALLDYVRPTKSLAICKQFRNCN